MSTISLNLEKGISLNLSKEVEGLKNINIGLGWKTTIDLDAFAIMLDVDNKVLGVTYYAKKDVLGVRLSGDDLVGGKVGDCETLFVRSDLLNKKVKKICLCANIFNQYSHTFNDVEDSYIRLINADTDKQILIYNLKDNTRNYNAIHFADLDVTSEGLIFTTIGEGLNGSIGEIKNIIAQKNKISNDNPSNTDPNNKESNTKNLFNKLFKR